MKSELPASRIDQRERGFALVVVLLLLSLLVAMLVALVTMTVAESRVVKATAKLQLARANALVGLQRSVQVLQESAGRDQCTTTPANLLTSNPANPWLVGVMPRGSDNDATVWLTSGSKLDPSSDFPVVDPKTRLPTPSRTEGRTVWLARHAVNDKADLSVKAVKVPITTNDLPLRGIAKGTHVRIGNYAWWASDESLKAKANLRAQPSGWSGDIAQREQSWHMASAPRTAPWKTQDLKLLPKDDARTERVLTFEQLPLLSSDSTTLMKNLGLQFHNYTAESLGVLCNARNGGLRRDLSLAFEMSDLAFDADPTFGIPLQGLGGDAGVNSLSPNWRTMRDYYQAWRTITGNNGAMKSQAYAAYRLGSTKPQDSAVSSNRFLTSQAVLLPVDSADLKKGDEDDKISPKTTAFMPTVVRLQHAISVMTKEAPDAKDGEGPLKLVVALDPVMTVWNPYNTKLSTEIMRVDDRLPEVHVVIELRQPWNPDKLYKPQEEVYHKATIFRALRPNKGSEPPGMAGEWEDQKRKWSLGTDMTLRQMLFLYKIERASFLLTQDGVTTGTSSPFVLEPGELAVFSSTEKEVKVHEDGSLVPSMKRGWNPDGGIGFDRLAPLSVDSDGDDKNRFWLRVYDKTEVRVTIEPYRRNSQHYKDNDPFEFIKTYEAYQEKKGKPIYIPELLDEPETYMDRLNSDGSQDTAYFPNDYAEYLGAFTGGKDALSSYTWSGTRRGNFVNLSYETRAYHGKDEADAKKPLPGICDPNPMLVSTHLQKDKKRYLGLFDWCWKTEAESAYPAQPMTRFNPRFGLLTEAPRDKILPRGGYPCTVPHFQVQLRTIASDKDIIEVDGNFRSFWGPSHTAQAEQQVPMFEVPQAPLISLGQLQHWPSALSPYDSGYGVGSSWASPFVPRDDKQQQFKLTNPKDNTVKNMRLPDPSWWLNRRLFDDFYFSSICSYPNSDKVGSRLSAVCAEKHPKLLPNTRLRLHVPPDMKSADIPNLLDPTRSSSGDAQPYEKAAAFLFVDGPFNVNSTSKEAWKAVLAGCDDLKVPAYPGALFGPSSSVLSRLCVTNGPAADRWRGYRSLTDSELDSLAQHIVNEVQTRGPFPSLADFVNRRLGDNDTGLCGTLQAAIDRTRINQHLKTNVTLAALQHAAAQREEGADDWAFPYPLHATGPVLNGQTGCLQQGDLLQMLAPILTVRGDTFKVRTYGDVINPITGALEARAWCEAIVQRMPEYVHHQTEGASKGAQKGDPPWGKREGVAVPQPGDGPDQVIVKDQVNQRLGRAFRVVRLRWLSPDEV